MSRSSKWKQTRKYLLGIFLLVFFLLLFDRGLYYLIHASTKQFYKRKDFKNVFYQKRDFNKQFVNLPKGTYNTLIFGSSRTHRGIHPFYIHKHLKQNAFKIAKGKIRFKFNYYFYNEYKKYAGTPRVVIYGIDYFMFNQESDPAFLRFVTDETDAAPSGEAVGVSRYYTSGISMLLTHKTESDRLLNNVLDGLNKKINAPASGKSSAKFNVIDPFVGYGKRETMSLQKPPRFKTFPYVPYPGPEGLYFTRLLKQWEDEGVQVVLVILPEFVGTYESNFQRDRFLGEIKSLTAAYSNVSIYNYNSPETFSLSNADYFQDGGYGKTNSHLSRKGGGALNRKLVKDLRKHYRPATRGWVAPRGGVGGPTREGHMGIRF
ncbi:MAG: hypothetical protein GY765_43240 [bacterium]|nr:hypothetical protein [bacterium]